MQTEPAANAGWNCIKGGIIMKRKPIALLLGLAVLLSGCGVQPAASQPESAAPAAQNESIAETASPDAPQESAEASEVQDASVEAT